jgi:hypothetical protein
VVGSRLRSTKCPARVQFFANPEAQQTIYSKIAFFISGSSSSWGIARTSPTNSRDGESPSQRLAFSWMPLTEELVTAPQGNASTTPSIWLGASLGMSLDLRRARRAYYYLHSANHFCR